MQRQGKVREGNPLTLTPPNQGVIFHNHPFPLKHAMQTQIPLRSPRYLFAHTSVDTNTTPHNLLAHAPGWNFLEHLVQLLFLIVGSRGPRWGKRLIEGPAAVRLTLCAVPWLCSGLSFLCGSIEIVLSHWFEERV